MATVFEAGSPESERDRRPWLPPRGERPLGERERPFGERERPFGERERLRETDRDLLLYLPRPFSRCLPLEFDRDFDRDGLLYLSGVARSFFDSRRLSR